MKSVMMTFGRLMGEGIRALPEADGALVGGEYSCRRGRFGNPAVEVNPSCRGALAWNLGV